MRFIWKCLFVLALCLAGFSVQAAHTDAQLLLADTAARPGDTVLVGVQLRMDPGWHTYWKNSGASGMPTKVDWQLPPGVTAGDIQWPLPEKLPDQDLTTYIYKDEVVLLASLKLSPDLKPGPLDLKAKVSWLECEVQCVPGKADVQATLKVGPETSPSKEAALLQDWLKKLPRPGTAIGARAWWKEAAKGDLRPLVLEWNSASAASQVDFFPDSSEQYEVQAATERLPNDPGKPRLQMSVKKFSGDWPKQVSGVVVQKSGSETLAYAVTVPIASSQAVPALAAGSRAGAAAAAPASASLWLMLLYALVGGLILNVMPCVLPVIALKILGFVSQAKESPRQVRKLGLIYGAGVLVSFLVLAALVIGVKAAGHKAGWGMQFGNPEFLVILTVLVTLVALNLFGLYEVNPGSQVMGAAGSLAAKHGPAGAFFNGVLATILATPCTAPFLGAALGFAFAQKPPVVVLIFLTVGLGLALPYVLLSWEPAWLRFVPKPGPWMEKFKIAMGFPMLATAIWLFSLIPIHYGERSWWLGIFLVVVALVVWIFGQFVQRGRSNRGLAALVAAVVLLAGYLGVLEGRLHWRAPEAQPLATGSVSDTAGGVAWKPWSPQALAAARATGRPILVDFTAKWCVTCNTIVKPALESDKVRKKLEETNAVALLGDYTRFPDDITVELNRYGRAGVPLVLVYPKGADSQPMVLPEAVTPGMVADALDRAAR